MVCSIGQIWCKTPKLVAISNVLFAKGRDLASLHTQKVAPLFFRSKRDSSIISCSITSHPSSKNCNLPPPSLSFFRYFSIWGRGTLPIFLIPCYCLFLIAGLGKEQSAKRKRAERVAQRGELLDD